MWCGKCVMWFLTLRLLRIACGCPDEEWGEAVMLLPKLVSTVGLLCGLMLTTVTALPRPVGSLQWPPAATKEPTKRGWRQLTVDRWGNFTLSHGVRVDDGSLAREIWRHLQFDEDVREGSWRHLFHLDKEPLSPSVQIILLFDFPHDCGHQEQWNETSRKRDEELLQLQLGVLAERDLCSERHQPLTSELSPFIFIRSSVPVLIKIWRDRLC